MTTHSSDPYSINKALLASLQHLIIDGHNVLFGCSPFFGHYKAPEFPGSSNRQLLINASQALTETYSQMDIQLWFDGSAHFVSQPTNRLRVMYSGGEGKGRADREMIKSLIYLKSQGAGPRAIVTADKGLQRSARKNGAVILLPEEFSGLLVPVQESAQKAAQKAVQNPPAAPPAIASV